MTRMIAFLAATLVIAASAYPAHAQQQAPLLGFLSSGTESFHAGRYAAFRDKMRELGYVEGRTIRYAYRYGKGNNKRLAGLAAELVRLEPKVIVASGTPSTRAAQKATSTIPIVMSGGDPVRSGLVKSLARPGGNITGHTVSPGPEFYSKRLQILTEAVPAAKRIGVLYIAGNSFHQLSLRAVQASAGKIGVMILSLAVTKPEDVKGALDVIRRERAGAFFNMGSSILGSRMKEMLAFALDNRLPFMCTRARWVRQGCFISYGVDFHDMFRRKAIYADMILKGANPAEMPVQQPTEFDLTVNLKTAKALGVTVPPSILFRATEVIK